MNVQINNRRGNGKFTNMQKVNNVLLDNEQVKEETKRKILKYLKTKDVENTTHQNVQDVAVLRGKFIALNAYIRKEGGVQIFKTLTLHFKE